ncbi:ABC transporter substrate-binding protein [Fictibacillus macauensis ZFHKF-1]|uniref:Lipoprotein n=1 Tax=Fictibacillus macauensis ZFHKF-1 TaxID=1196324 RepID=I8AN43_9BACL|nr:methionine ABC transporter substrate-binding lipoprotein MetQ [Fictibacillus macauensis]EIT87154.1 ABC transporter substrate-binding protein [Fictibacillus macauensis ZFHKF-1]
MKKVVTIALVLLLTAALAACGGSKDGKIADDKIKVGASNVPHAEILEAAKPLLKKKGIDLEITTFQDYVLPNKALAQKKIDANYFQHIPYLEQAMKDHKDYKFVNAGKIHLEPMGVYSKKYKSLKELPEGATVIMSNNIAEQGRMLMLLEKGGLIKLKAGKGVKATLKDVAENPKHIKFKANVDPGLLPKVYKNESGDAVIINTNYAIDAGLTPKKDAIVLEGSESPFANIITVRKGDQKAKAVKALVEVLHSKEIQDFIKDKYKGAVLPAK